MFLIQFVTNFSSFKQLFDNTRPDATVSCKCIVLENKKLHLYKAGFVLPRVLSSHVNLSYYMVELICFW
jgi:hypothetical protein